MTKSGIFPDGKIAKIIPLNANYLDKDKYYDLNSLFVACMSDDNICVKIYRILLHSSEDINNYQQSINLISKK